MDIPEIDVLEAQQRIENGALLLDVRERIEYAEAHIAAQQILLPMSEYLGRYAQELPKDQEILVYCRSGRRSGKVVKGLNELGFNCLNLAGGILAWSEADLPTKSGND